jgi:hypothetical protein
MRGLDATGRMRAVAYEDALARIQAAKYRHSYYRKYLIRRCRVPLRAFLPQMRILVMAITACAVGLGYTPTPGPPIRGSFSHEGNRSFHPFVYPHHRGERHRNS